MTSPFHIRPRSQGHYLSRSVDTNYLHTSPFATHSYLDCASFDSTRTDLSANSKDVIIAGQWVVLGRIGEGSFGEVFEVEDIDTFRHYAIKREPTHIRNPQIQHEADIYDALAGGPGIPQCHWHGQHDGFDCIVIDLLGPNLQQLKELTKKFSIEIVVKLGVQMVSILEHIHKRGLIYRDVKPDNFLFSSKHFLPDPEMIETPDEHGMPHIKYKTPTCEQVFQKWKDPQPSLYVVDFGLTTWWRHPITNKPYPESKKNIKNKTGTARYASLNVHRGKMHSRRDDIESLGYLLVDLTCGTLPWTGIQARNSRVGWDIMKQIKEETNMNDICAGLPKGFLEFIEYSRQLKFTDEPDYDLLRLYLTGSLNDGPYSLIVEGEQTWMQEHIKPKPHSQPRHYYHETPPPPRQRRASYNPPSNRFYRPTEDTGVFAMDDLMHNLPPVQDSSRLSLPPPTKFRGNSLNKRSSRDFSRPQPDFSNRPTSQSTPKNGRGRRKRVGWNSHKHEEEKTSSIWGDGIKEESSWSSHK